MGDVLMRNFIGLDLGTTCVKALLFNEAGCVLSAASEDDELFTPHQGWAEQNAESWVDLSAKVIREAVSEAAVDPRSVEAISISSQGITVVPVGRDFRPLRKALNWLDQRAAEELEIVRSTISAEEVYAATGKSLSSAYTLPKILWLKRNEPELYSETYKLLLPHDYLCAHLCGIPVTDHTMAAGTMLYDVPNQRWSDNMLKLFEIDPGLLPELRWAGTPVGPLTKEASLMTGLPETTLLVTGGQDQKVSAYGASLRMGAATISFGTCAAMEFMFDHAPLHPTRDLSASSYIDSETWVLEACINTAGAAIKWARDTLFHDMSFDDMNALAETCETSGGVFFYPFLQGSGTPYNVPARGVFTGLTLGATRAQLIRAIYEGIAMEVYANLSSARAAGVSVREMCVFGGGSKSAVISQILADVTGCAIQTFSTPEMGAFGAARLAANAVGINDFSLPVSGIWEPDTARTEHYGKLYSSYKENLPAVLNLI